ncbi:MAG: putative integral rane protein [Rhodocyclales bacterium]|nr:putative integral rane protein [Rhodocyclales bacterium]
MQQDSRNPYAPPAASVQDVFEPGAPGTLIRGGRRVPAGNGVSWIGDGWEMFKQQAGPWIGLFIVFALVYLVVGFIPFINFFNVVLFPVLAGGVMIACENQHASGELKVGDLFAGLQRKFGSLALLGLMTFVLTIAVMSLVMLIMYLSVFGALAGGHSMKVALAGLGAGSIVAVVIGCIIAMSFVYAAAWYAPALIVLQDLSVFDAMKMSFAGGIKNILPGLIYGICMFVWAILASLPILLGWLVLAPLMWASMYVSYRDIYIEE